MNISLGDPSIATLDAMIPVQDSTMPLWDLLYAHQINISSATDVAETEVENNTATKDEQSTTR